jgi:hypothetical protein
MAMAVAADGVKTIKGEPLHTFLVADETASVQLCLWGELGVQVRPGDICELRSGWVLRLPFSHCDYRNGSSCDCDV